MAAEKTIVLCSGGLNSAVAASIAMKEGPTALLHVRFGHRAAEHEAELFEQQADALGVKERLVIEMPHFAAIGGNARVNRKRPIEDALSMGGGESACYIPGMVGSLLSAGLTWALTIHGTKISIGVCEELGHPGPRTATIFPDYNREFIQLFNHACSVASPHRPISVEAPLVDLSRVEIIKLGQRLGTRFDLTWSCLSSGTTPCGGCIGCATRQRGFLDAALPDPVMLQPAAV
jgi:7-cyano-7-deazaguanine synthase